MTEYEFGYITWAEGEKKTVILDRCSSRELPAKQQEIAYANSFSENHHTTKYWFVRKIDQV